MTATKNLWSEDLLKGEDTLLPVTILQQQAKYLNEMTRNIVVANIETKRVTIAAKINQTDTKQGILHTLKIVAPAIGNYDFDLLRIMQEHLLPYPLKIFAPLTDESYDAKNSQEFEDVLKFVFNHPKTVETIQILILQSK
jgi:hypothetical protein